MFGSSSSSLCSTAVGQNIVKKEEENVKEANPFSEAWEESDLVLVVEEETFHVHRQILSIHSPVFKAMLNSKFKEATTNEIPLPGKKPNEILDFLKQMYLKERDGIKLNKVEHLLKLADEYQTISVFDLCVKCLKDEPKSKQNAVQIIFLANSTTMAQEDPRLDSVRSKCYDLIKDMELKVIMEKKDFKNLDHDSLSNVFVQRTERLEKFLKKAFPQVIGLVEYCLYLKLCSQSESSSQPATTSFHNFTPAGIKRCPEHFPSGGNKTNEEFFERTRSCKLCRKMILQLVSASKLSKVTPYSSREEHLYGGKYHFDDQLISIIQDFKTMFSDC